MPPEAKLRLVDIGANLAVIRDRSNRQGDPDRGAHQRINEFAEECQGARNEVEWRDCAPDWPDGKTEKNWPVAYVRGSKMELSRVEFKVKANPALANVTITGTAELGDPGGGNAGKLTFTKAGVNQAGDVISATALKADRALPNYVTSFVNDNRVTINWELSFKDGNGKDVTLNAGSSSHTVFVLFNRPTITTLFVTPLDFSTARARGQDAQDAVVDNIWLEFQGQAIVRRSLDPVGGAITTAQQPTLQYYTRWRMEDFFDFNRVCPVPVNTSGLLAQVIGRCGTWGVFLVETLRMHGIASTNNSLSAMRGWTDLAPPTSNRNVTFFMLINDWTFPGPARQLPLPYLTRATLRAQSCRHA